MSESADQGTVADLARIQDVIRIEDLLDLTHKLEYVFAHGLFQIDHLGMTDGVLAGDLSFQFGTLGVCSVHDDFDFLLEFLFLQIIGAAVDMQVTVTGVTEVADPDSILFTQLTDVDQEIGDLVHGNHHVHLIDESSIT